MDKVFRIVIHGADVIDIPSFYRQINDQLMRDEEWTIGDSLDAFNDLLYGGFGAAHDSDVLEIEWRDIGASRDALGVDATRDYYRAKIADGRFDSELFRAKLRALESGRGATYFDMLMEIIGDHDRVRLIADAVTGK